MHVQEAARARTQQCKFVNGVALVGSSELPAVMQPPQAAVGSKITAGREGTDLHVRAQAPFAEDETNVAGRCPPRPATGGPATAGAASAGGAGVNAKSMRMDGDMPSWLAFDKKVWLGGTDGGTARARRRLEEGRGLVSIGLRSSGLGQEGWLGDTGQ